jgi:glycosyltransferase involved in cell wall biosynthesis
VIANSPETARAASADLRIDLSRFRVIPNGVVIPTVPQDSSNVRKKFGIRADDVVVLCVSRLSFTKGVERLVESAKTVIRRRKNVYYILVGSGEIEARIRESVRLNGMEDRFFLAGSVENDQLHEYYSAADLFVVPTSPGTTLLEAMSYGKPFIVYTLAGDLPAGVSVAEIERRNVGIVLRDVSLDSLSRVIVDIVDDENWRIVMGARCKEYVQSELSWPKVASAMISVYRELIEGVI